jgi:hypothetical protein
MQETSILVNLKNLEYEKPIVLLLLLTQLNVLRLTTQISKQLHATNVVNKPIHKVRQRVRAGRCIPFACSSFTITCLLAHGPTSTSYSNASYAMKPRLPNGPSPTPSPTGNGSTLKRCSSAGSIVPSASKRMGPNKACHCR